MKKSSRNQIHMRSLDFMTHDAIAFIQEHEPPDGYYVGFSGGKDSIVTLELTRMSGVKHQAYYSATGIDPPEVVQFIRKNYPNVIHLRPAMSFWEGIYLNHPPLRTQRWCCDVLKKKPSAHIALPNRIMGLRAEESARRAIRPRIDYHEKTKQTIFKPIFQWKEWHIWEFIEQRYMPYPSLYDEGFSRIGCVVCPFLCRKNQGAINKHRQRWPKFYLTFERAVTRWWHKMRLRNDFDQGLYKDTTPEEYIKRWYMGFE